MVGTGWWRGGRTAPKAARQRLRRSLWSAAGFVVRWGFLGLVMLSTLPAVAKGDAANLPGTVFESSFGGSASHINKAPLPPLPAGFTSDRSTIHERLGKKQLKSTEGKGIPLWSITSPDLSHSASAITPTTGSTPIYAFLVQGGLHGNEVATSKFVRWLYRRVSAGNSPLNKLPGRFTIDFLPYANPDRFGKSRYNANAVNLNRNFGAFWGRSFEPNGTGPFSEKETLAIRTLMKSKKYLAAVDVHGYAKWVVAPSQNPKGHTLAQWQLDRYQRWRQEITTSMSKSLPGYRLISALGLGDGGAFEDWSFWHNDTLAFCLEMASAKRFVGEKSSLVDMFPRYELFITDMFKRAIAFEQAFSVAIDAGPLPSIRRPLALPAH